MAEPARIYDEDDEQPVTRPDLKALEGGGESTAPKRGHLSSVKDEDEAKKSMSPEELEKAEESGTEGAADTEPAEEEESFYNPNDDAGGRFKRLKTTRGLFKKRRTLFIGGGIAMAFLGGLFAIFSFLMPFKLFHIIQTIEQKVGKVPGYAVERRMEYYMNRYLIIRQLQGSGLIDENGKGRDGYIYIGDGAFKTLYTNWRGAKLETVMKNKYGVKLTAELPPNEFGRQYLKPTNWTAEFEGTSRRLNLNNSKEARAFIRDFIKTETRSHQVLKRFHHRRIMRNYFGVNDWKLFENQRDKARRSYLEKKLIFKKYLVGQTVGRFSSRYAKWLNCLLEGKEKCKEIRRANVAGNPRDPVVKDKDGNVVGGSEEVPPNEGLGPIDSESGSAPDVVAKDLPGGVADKNYSKKLTAKLREVGLKRILASFAGGIGILDAISQIEKSLTDGALNIVVYDKNAQQYAAFAAPFLSAADQIRAGEDIDANDVRVATEIFDSFETSPVYQGAINDGSKVSAAGQIRRDCNDDGNTTDKDDLLEPGETVCPDKRLVQDRTTFTNSDGWKIFSGVAAAYRKSVGKIVSFFVRIVDKAFDVTGLNSVVQGVLDATGLSDLAASAFKSIMNRVAGPVLTGAETGADAYDAVYAGMAVQQSALGGGVGVNREQTIGGAYLSEKQVAAIRAEEAEYREYERQNMNFFARYFSPYHTTSLTSKLAASLPASAGNARQQFAKIGSMPFNLFGNISSLFSARASAVEEYNVYNPFHAIYYGYPADDQVFEMEPEELNQKYQCDLPADKRPQNQDAAYGRPIQANGQKMPFDVATQTDPCLLETAVEDAGSRYFTGNYDEGI